MSGNWHSPDKFNKAASQWDENPRRTVLAQTVAQALIAAVAPHKSMNVLEFGCGTGLVTFEIAPLVKNLVAVDTSIEMMNVMQQKIKAFELSNIKTACLDLLSPSVAEESKGAYDLIYASMTLHHIADTAGFLSHLAHFLSPGGRIALADLELEDGFFHDDEHEKVHQGFERAALTEQLIAAGMKLTSFETIYSLNKVNRAGRQASYPIFLVTATKVTL